MDQKEFDELLSRMIAELAPLVMQDAASLEPVNGHFSERATARILGRVMARIAAAEYSAAVGLEMKSTHASRRCLKSAGRGEGMDDAPPVRPASAARASKKPARLDFEQLEPRNPLSAFGAFAAHAFESYCPPPAETWRSTPRFVSSDTGLALASSASAIAVLW
jgi:hypothetical protein